MASLEIRSKFENFETIELYNIKSSNGEEYIWKTVTEIKNGEEIILWDSYYTGADHHPELQTPAEIHQFLVDFLHKIEEKQKEDVDPDDNTVFIFTPDPEEKHVFSVYEGHMDALRKKIRTIENKCKKYGCEFHYEEIGEEYKEVPTGEKDPLTNKPITVTCKYILIRCEGTAVINDWEFVASVEHTEAGNIYSKAMNDLEIPHRYRTTGSCTCEHCKTKRMRKDTFIIHNKETDEFMQVGKSCLRDFTGGMSASGMAWFASLKQVFQDAEDQAPDYSGMRWYQKNYPVEEVLQFTAETIRHFGFVPASMEYPTKHRMQEFFDVCHGNTYFWDPKEVNRVRDLMQSVGFDPDSPEAVQKAQDALAWVKAQDSTTDYMHNLKTVCALSYVNSGRFGLLVSIFPAMDRELEKQAQIRKEMEAGKISDHVGNIGDRITVEVQSVKCLTSWESNFGYYPTITYLYKITGTDGNIFTWKTQKGLDEDHPPKTIKGTVKDHKVYREVKQTELTRCKTA